MIYDTINTATVKKWAPLLEHEKFEKIGDNWKNYVTAAMLENTHNFLREDAILGGYGSRFLTEAPTNSMGASSSTPGDGALDIYDPVLISMVRRAMPKLIAYDICGVQPMTGPAGLIFAMRARYANQAGDETFYNESDTDFSTVVTGANTLGQKHTGTIPGNNTIGNTTGQANLAELGIYNFGSGMSTATQEALGESGGDTFPEMALSIERMAVTAKGRALKAEYSIESAQDMKTIHNFNMEDELSNILTTQLVADINREIVRTMYVTAKQGATDYTTTSGRYNLDIDSNGRWMAEKYKSLYMFIETEANRIAKETRLGKGNFVICSSNVAAALNMAGMLDYAPALNDSLTVDDTGPTFAGVLNKRYRVYIDPYAGGDFVVVGYKGSTPMHAGLFYCPYVPLVKVRAVNADSMQPKIGYKTRYGVVAHPFAQGLTAGNGALVKDSNVFYRRTLVDRVM